MTGVIVVLFFVGLIAVMLSDRPSESIFHKKIEGPSAFAVGGLFLALLALSERILYDISRFLVGTNYDYFEDLRTIVAHSFFIIPVLILSLIINLHQSEEKREKYSLILIPYFLLSIVLAMQLALQISVYFSENHTTIQLYIVLAALIAITSYAIYWVQKRFEIKE